MRVRTMMLAVFIALPLFIVSLHAQNKQTTAAPASSGNVYVAKTDGSIFSFDFAMLAGYDLVTKSTLVGSALGLNVTVSEMLQMGVAYNMIQSYYPYLRMSFFFTRGFGLDTCIVFDKSFTWGSGLFVNLISTSDNSPLFTALKFKVDYFINPAKLPLGQVICSLGATVAY